MRMEWTYLLRYPFNAAMELLTGYCVFLLIIVGARSFAAERAGLGQTEGGIIVGFMVLSFVLMSYRRIAYGLMEEAARGTLEQVSMSPLGPARVIAARMVSYVSISFAVTSVQLILMMATTGRWLHFDPFSLIPLLLLTFASGQGIGFVMGGLALVYKQVEQGFQMLGWIFLGLVMAPIDRWPVLAYLPVCYGTELIRSMLLEGRSILDMGGNELGFLALHASVYMVAGLWVFLRMDQRARRDGSLGHY